MSIFRTKKEKLLSYALGARDLSAISKWLQKGADVNFKDPDMWGWTPLHIAAHHSHADVAELLIANGADVNAECEGGCTPLHIAAGKGSKSVAELLLAKGADANARDNGGDTPLRWVLTKDVAELLIARGADVNVMNNNGQTPLDAVLRKGLRDVAETLKKHGAKKGPSGHEKNKAELSKGGIKEEPSAEHAIIWCGESQYILTDISRSGLKEKILGSQLAWILDINTAGQVDELCSKGKTEITQMGVKKEVTLRWCDCTNPASHKRPGVTSLGQ